MLCLGTVEAYCMLFVKIVDCEDLLFYTLTVTLMNKVLNKTES